MKLKIRVIVRVDVNDDGLMDEWTEKWTLISHHATSRCDSEFSLSVSLTLGSQNWLMLTSKESLGPYTQTIQALI